jgi:hypothetical protein
VSLFYCVLIIGTGFVKTSVAWWSFQVVIFVWLFNLYWLCIALLQRHVHEVLLAKCCNFQYLSI